MEIRVYDRELSFLGSVEDHTSLIWTRKFYEPGDFELHAPITEKNLSLLKAENIIAKRGGAEAGVVEDVEIEASGVKNELTLRGRFLSSYFDRRLIQSTVNFKGTVEAAMRQLIGGVAPIPLLQLGAAAGFPETIEFQATMKNLCTYLTKLARGSAIGYRVRPDFRTKKLIFETYKGADRTMSQGVRARVIFSEKYENINNAVYRYNDQMYRTKVFVGGEGEGSNRKYVTIGGGTGLDLREMFVDAKDVTSEGLTPAQYTEALTTRGLEAKAEAVIATSMECETDPDVNFKYRTDYDLGDVATVEKRAWGIRMDRRITEIMEVHQFGGMFISPTLGDPLPEKIDWGE